MPDVSPHMRRSQERQLVTDHVFRWMGGYLPWPTESFCNFMFYQPDKEVSYEDVR